MGMPTPGGSSTHQTEETQKGFAYGSSFVEEGRLGWPGRQQATTAHAQVDPGVRGGAAGAGAPFADLTDNEHSFFEVGLEDFEEAEGGEEWATLQLDGCAGCHLPAVGGTSPAVNPQVAVATAFGAEHRASFITLNGPVREARFKFNPDGSRDGGVHALFTIRGRVDRAATRRTATPCRTTSRGR